MQGYVNERLLGSAVLCHRVNPELHSGDEVGHRALERAPPHLRHGEVSVHLGSELFHLVDDERGGAWFVRLARRHQRIVTVIVTRRQISAAVDEAPDQVNAAVPRREVYRPLHARVWHSEHLHAEVRPRRVAEKPDKYVAAAGLARRVHRAVPALVGDERVRARVHEHVEGIYVPAPRGEQHGRLARVGSIVHHRRRRALGRAKQHLHHRVRAALRGEVKWGLPVVAHHAYPRALVEQQLHHASVLAHRRQVQRGVPRGRGLVEVNNLTRVVFREFLRRDCGSRRVRVLAPRPRLVDGQSRALLDRDDPVPGVAYEHAGRGRVPGHRGYVHRRESRIGSEGGVHSLGRQERLDDRGGPSFRGEVQRRGAGRVYGARVRAWYR